EGIDFLSVIKGNLDSDNTMAKIIAPMGTPAAVHLDFAGRVKHELDIPVMHAGRIADLATARYAISEGLLDMVGSYDLSVLQAEFSLTQMLDAPVSGRVFFEHVIRDNLDLGRPDQVTLVFDRRLMRRGPRATPGRFRTRVITEGVTP
ncbi:hypothetical protein P3H15_54935, partial [Rhodococcus sp. T2V]|nr:hypothetical protein [Rhodococcus sp. T2V]